MENGEIIYGPGDPLYHHLNYLIDIKNDLKFMESFSSFLLEKRPDLIENLQSKIEAFLEIYNSVIQSEQNFSPEFIQSAKNLWAEISHAVFRTDINQN